MANTPEVIHLNNLEIDILRSAKRKSTQLIIKNGKLLLRTPSYTTRNFIEAILQKNEQWIFNKLQEQQQNPHLYAKTYSDGEPFLYLGKEYRLKVIHNVSRKIEAELIENNLVIYIPKRIKAYARYIKKTLHEWYFKQAEATLLQQTLFFSKMIQVQPIDVKIKAFKAQWGNCSHKGLIQYNWRLILAPQEMIDYVIVHELCHILHHNHSKDFWNCVAHYLPDYKKRRAWLKINGHALLSD